MATRVLNKQIFNIYFLKKLYNKFWYWIELNLRTCIRISINYDSIKKYIVIKYNFLFIIMYDIHIKTVSEIPDPLFTLAYIKT